MTANNLDSHINHSALPSIDIKTTSDAAGTTTTAAVDLQDSSGCLWIFDLTDINTSGTVDSITVQTDDNSGFSSAATATDGDGNNIAYTTQITATGIFMVRVDAKHCERYVRLAIVDATANVAFAVASLPFGSQYKPNHDSTELILSA